MSIDAADRIAFDVIDRQATGFSTVRVMRDATGQNPARLVLLRRHADMADETPAAEARTDVERGADDVASILGSISSQGETFDLTSVVEKAHNVLKGSGTYYSILVAMVTMSRVIAAGIGDVTLQLWTEKGAEPMLKPTTVPVGSTRVLSSALGLGFDVQRIQTANLSLGTGDRIIVSVAAEVSFFRPMQEDESAADVLQRIVKAASFKQSAIIGVIAAPSPRAAADEQSHENHPQSDESRLEDSESERRSD
jgi:hypothetical protein